ncbi:amidohydrolase family protein [Muricauda sp. CAU 1633]|uniref:amidohydrolase n=1 Tax=Allomuricauda sp. CAU 1633 TaxID=2816036 RepID=UPI001A8F7111|nr:amidohydrolase family protein [Muricauda sp. CAU 1633]MBO0323672.1 amidohydrolase family protein [Muricauda sp. CAU 1633]
MKNTFAFLFGICLLLISCNNKSKKGEGSVEAVAEPYQLKQTIFYNGEIITMEGDEPQYVEAVVEREGQIIFVGSQDEAFEKYEDVAKKHNLNGETMMPGFVEPHIHGSIAATMLPNEIIAPYDWVLPNETKKGVSGHENYIARITKSINQNATEDAIYIIWGYHQLWHGELNREMLNKIAGNKPVGIIHRSFHEIFVNDAAINMMGINEEEFKDNSQVDWKNGHFYEGGWLALVPRIGNLFFAKDKYLYGLEQMSQLITKNGITTVADPGFPNSSFELEYNFLKTEMDKKPPYDYYIIPNGTQLYGMRGNSNEKAKQFSETLTDSLDTENIKFLPKQIKLFSDGAIYSQLMQMKGDYTDGHKGEWMTPLDLFKEQTELYWSDGYKIHVHANGDLGIQMVVDNVVELQRKQPREDHQFTLHHMGYFSDDMAEQIANLGIEASVNPYYLWALADKYSEEGLGKERGENLVRVNSLVSRDIPVSFHSDFSMAPVEPLTLAWTAINRVTSQDTKVSQDQRISVFDGMKGITIDAARTIMLEDKIGSIKEGKQADFTILAKNPFKIDPMEIKDIKVKGVVYKGQFHINKVANLK